MKKLKNIRRRIDAWWFYMPSEDKNVIEFIGGIAFCIFLLCLCLWVGYEAGKAGLGS